MPKGRKLSDTFSLKCGEKPNEKKIEVKPDLPSVGLFSDEEKDQLLVPALRMKARAILQARWEDFNTNLPAANKLLNGMLKDSSKMKLAGSSDDEKKKNAIAFLESQGFVFSFPVSQVVTKWDILNVPEPEETEEENGEKEAETTTSA